tara:strand:- start:80600 stop:81319 length:720 start_codon:yes stop_codon:yes gene_type:complete
MIENKGVAMRRMMILLGCLLMTAPALAQDSDPDTHHPAIMMVPNEDGSESQFVVGDMAWGDVLATMVRLRAIDPAQSAAIAEDLWARRDLNAPIFLFEVARLTAESNPDRALQAYFLARARTIYDASRCVDPSAIAVVDMASAQAGDAINDLLVSDPARVASALERVIQSGEVFTGQASPWWACSSGSAAYYAAVNQAAMPREEWLKVESTWQPLRNAITNNLNANLAMIRDGQLGRSQ